MKFHKILRIAWDGLMLNKIRSFLTTLGVIIGVASVIVMMAVSAGAEAVIAEQINALGANLLIVSPMRGVPGAARTLLYEDALAISRPGGRHRGVSAEQAPPPQTVKANGVTLDSIAIIGTTADFPNVRDYPVAEGTYFSEQDNDRKLKVAVLGAGLATDLFGAESPIGQTITVGSTKLTVIGVMQSKGVVADIDYDGRVYLPISVVFQRYMTSGSPMRADRPHHLRQSRKPGQSRERHHPNHQPAGPTPRCRPGQTRFHHPDPARHHRHPGGRHLRFS
jgi:putative ABC transport system permease protein